MQRSMILMLAAAIGVFAALGIARPASAQCDDCWTNQGSPLQHYFELDSHLDDPFQDPHYYLQDGTCEEWHLECLAPEAAADVPTLVGLITLVQTADVAELSRLLEAHGTVITLNMSRRAVQVLSCGDRVAAHIPITNEEFLQTLTATSVVATLGDDIQAPRD